MVARIIQDKIPFHCVKIFSFYDHRVNETFWIFLKPTKIGLRL